MSGFVDFLERLKVLLRDVQSSEMMDKVKAQRKI
jgi:hypothetical protein